MNQALTDTQLALREAFFKAENDLAHLVDKMPEKPENPSPYERVSFCDALSDFRSTWNLAVGFRDGLQKACQIAGIQGF